MVVDANGGPCSGERAVNGVGDGGADGGAQGRGSQRPRVLIADDEDMVRIVAEAALTAAGFEVNTVNPTLLPRHVRRELQAHLGGRTESFEVIAWVGSDRTERPPRT